MANGESGFRRAITSLAQLEEKLRRNLGLAGAIGAIFEPRLTPVIIAADLREAGNASNQGRAWAWSSRGATGNLWTVAGNISIVAVQDIRIDRIRIGANAAGIITLWLTAPDQAPAIAPTALEGTWIDRKRIGGDQFPLNCTVVPGALTGTASSSQNIILHHPQSTPLEYLTNIMLPIGGALNVNGNIGTTIALEGRVWP